MKYSIIIPTYNHCNDLLKPCIESILKNTIMDDIEIIVIANGCTDNTKEYLNGLNGFKLRTLLYDKPLGFPKAINAGLAWLSDDRDAIVLNNDTIILPQQKHTWIKMLENLFTNPRIGIVGPLRLYDYWVKQYYIHFFCAMIKHEVIKKIGLLDEIFGYGNSEDLDYCLRAKANGFEIASLPVKFNTTTTMKIAQYPIFHMAHVTVDGISDFNSNAEKNIAIIKDRYLNLPPEKFDQEVFIT